MIWSGEFGIRGKSEAPRGCLDVLRKLESHYPEPVGFVSRSVERFCIVVGICSGRKFMTPPKMVALDP